MGVANPYCPELAARLHAAATDLKFRTHKGGTYVCIEGPQFSTKAESKVYRSMGFSVIGMTNVPEFKLAREAEICYASVALVTDYDVWKEEQVTVDMVIGNLTANTANVKQLLKSVITKVARDRRCECATALEYAIITDRNRIPAKAKKDLKPLIGKYFLMIKAVIFDFDNTLMDFMRMKKAAVESAVDSMIDAGLPLKKADMIEKVYKVYTTEGIEDQLIFDKVLSKEFGKVDYKILAAGIIGYRRAKEGTLALYPHVQLTLTGLARMGFENGGGLGCSSSTGLVANLRTRTAPLL